MEHRADVSNSTLQERIAALLERDIVEGRVAPGQRLLQNELASRFNVSHIPVREALRTLGARGLVDISPQRGARAAAFSAEEIHDILEVRILLETAALKAAIPRLERSDFVALAQAIRYIDIERDPARWPALNRAFHMALYRPAKRPALLRLIAQLHDDPRCARVAHIITSDRRKSNLEHQSLVDAARRGAITEAAALLRSHIDIQTKKLNMRLALMERGVGRK